MKKKSDNCCCTGFISAVEIYFILKLPCELLEIPPSHLICTQPLLATMPIINVCWLLFENLQYYTDCKYYIRAAGGRGQKMEVEAESGTWSDSLSAMNKSNGLVSPQVSPWEQAIAPPHLFRLRSRSELSLSLSTSFTSSSLHFMLLCFLLYPTNFL